MVEGARQQVRQCTAPTTSLRANNEDEEQLCNDTLTFTSAGCMAAFCKIWSAGGRGRHAKDDALYHVQKGLT